MDRWDRDGAGQGYARAEVGWMDQDAVGLLVPWGRHLTRTLVPFGAVGYCYFRKGGSFPVRHTRTNPPLTSSGTGGRVDRSLYSLWPSRMYPGSARGEGSERRTGGRAGRARGKVLAKSTGTDWLGVCARGRVM